MSEQPLHQQLANLLVELDRLRQLHEEAQEHAAASERLTFALGRVLLCQTALAELRAASRLLTDLGDPEGAVVWTRTREELRRLAPADLRLSAAALRSASLDLLRLVEYTGAVASLVTERRGALERRLAERTTAGSDPAPASGGSSCEVPAD